MNKKLTDKEEAFCNEYMIDFNGTQAAIRAGYSEKTAGVIASENLKKPNIEARLLELKQQAGKKYGVTVQNIVDELRIIGFADFKDFYDKDGALLPIQGLKPEVSRAINKLKTDTTTYNGSVSKKVEFGLNDKIRALEMLGKIVGAFEKDNEQSRAQVVITGMRIE